MLLLRVVGHARFLKGTHIVREKVGVIASTICVHAIRVLHRKMPVKRLICRVLSSLTRAMSLVGFALRSESCSTARFASLSLLHLIMIVRKLGC